MSRTLAICRSFSNQSYRQTSRTRMLRSSSSTRFRVAGSRQTLHANMVFYMNSWIWVRMKNIVVILVVTLRRLVNIVGRKT